MKKLISFLAVASVACAAFTSCESEENDAPRQEMRILTFEDADAKFTPFLLNGSHEIATWSDLIDDVQYGGALLYNDMVTTNYFWHDGNNTSLYAEIVDGGPFWNGGHAISNYASTDIAANGTYEQQLAVYGEEGRGGNNSSANFCIHNGMGVAPLEFRDGVERVIDHLYVAATTYCINVYENGGGFTVPATEESWFKLTATGYDAAGNETASTEIYLAEGTKMLRGWQRWSLASLGKVQSVRFAADGSDVGEYGLNTPSYFAYDDVAVLFD